MTERQFCNSCFPKKHTAKFFQKTQVVRYKAPVGPPGRAPFQGMETAKEFRWFAGEARQHLSL